MLYGCTKIIAVVGSYTKAIDTNLYSLNSECMDLKIAVRNTDFVGLNLGCIAN